MRRVSDRCILDRRAEIMTSPDSVPDYAPRRGSIVTKRFWRWLAIIVCLSALAVMAWIAARVAGAARMHQVAIECFHSFTPADQVVMEENPLEAQRLLAKHIGYFPYREPTEDDTGQPRNMLAAGIEPSCLVRLRTLRLGRPPQIHWPILFLHGRTTWPGLSTGRSDLICVSYDRRQSDLGLIELRIEVFDLGSWTRPPSIIHGEAMRLFKGPNDEFLRHSVDTRSLPMRLFAGQPDPADASRFAIRYEIGGRFGTIEGVYDPDEMHWVQMRVLDGPLVSGLRGDGSVGETFIRSGPVDPSTLRPENRTKVPGTD